ncbi:MAG TPA: class I SAM-dependent methyltransferase [Polyangiaceae bacterium]|nr:class I SAM-dependent methyltransferase [Polyangiaceae bacterium]
MSVFGAYSQYYDLLYKDKDYAGEAAYVRSLIERYQPGARSVLDLGCGTGRHALLLAESGYRVTGVDLSADMLQEANALLASASPERAARLSASGALPTFLQGDVRTVRTGRKFDVVVSLFHVMSYQTSNDDLKAALHTIREHLLPGGVVVFDCWYGPAVLTDRPSSRSKHLENERISVVRDAMPVLYPNRNCVDVNYHVRITDKQSGALQELRETHTMRYLFSPEVELLLSASGFELRDSTEFMTNRPLGFDTWNAVFVATLRA